MINYEILLQSHNILIPVQDLVKRNEHISAIKLVKDKTGLSLKESKDIVDSIDQSFHTTDTLNDKSSFSTDEILQKDNIGEKLNILLQQDKKIEAIKLVIDATGMDLLNAKNFVESIQNKETTFSPESLENFSNISVKMTNKNGKITVKIKEGHHPEKAIYPNDPSWEKAKKMLGNKPELLQYENEFRSGKHPIPQKKSNLFVETDSYGKWILFFVLFCAIMLVIYYYSSIN